LLFLIIFWIGSHIFSWCWPWTASLLPMPLVWL
jgi:hypothetical protein